jgi:DNA-binding transcriptional ArsR family regulator
VINSWTANLLSGDCGLKRKEAFSLCLIVLAFSVSLISIAYSGNSIPNLNAVQDVDGSQRIFFSMPLVFMACLQGNSTPLNQPSRQEIYTYVTDNPGVHFRGICSALGIPIGVAQYHLSVLVHAGLLTAYCDGQNKRYFESRTYTQTNAKLISLLRHDTARKILVVLSQEGSVLHKDLAKDLGVSSQALTWQMNQLKKTGLIEAVKEGLSVKYFLNEENTAEIRLLLNVAGKSRM